MCRCKKPTARHIIVKILKTKVRKILKKQPTRNDILAIRENNFDGSMFPTRNHKGQEEVVQYFPSVE